MAGAFEKRAKCGHSRQPVAPGCCPNPFLNNAVVRLSRRGVLAVTATDTSALAGAYPKACLRKYWAVPLRNEEKHEIAVRILVRKVQLVGAQFDRALVPVFSYAKDHYVRVFFRNTKGKEAVDSVLNQHGMYKQAGPMWLGELWDKKLVGLMWKHCDKENRELLKLLSVIRDEMKIGTVGFHDYHRLSKVHKFKSLPKIKELIAAVKDKGYKASETHFDQNGIKSDIDEKELVRIIKQII